MPFRVPFFHLLEHGAAGAVDELTVDDVSERLRIDNHPYVVRADVAQEVEHASFPVHTHLGDQGNESREMPPKRDAATDRDIGVLLVIAWRGPLVPAVVPGRDPHRIGIAR